MTEYNFTLIIQGALTDYALDAFYKWDATTPPSPQRTA
jgi:hypothetical protein